MKQGPENLIKFLRKNYLGARFGSVYKAGFCGYWIDRKLRVTGIKNIGTNSHQFSFSFHVFFVYVF